MNADKSGSEGLDSSNASRAAQGTTALLPPGAEPSAAFPHEDIVSELSFVIAERLSTIGSIRRERKESDKIKAIRIAICEKMIARTRAARAMVEAFPHLLAVLRTVMQLAEQIQHGNATPQGGAKLIADTARAALEKARAASAASPTPAQPKAPDEPK